jgi:hypothetical protein
MSTAVRDRNKGIELEIEQVGDLEREFKSLPNALHRGEASKVLGLDFTGMTLRGRALLAALLSMSSGYRCSRDRIAKLAPELKRDGLDTVLKELRERGHLRQVRVNAEGGKFFWRWSVSLRPIFAGQAMSGKSGDGLEPDERDETIPGSTVDGRAVDGSAVDGSSGPCRSNKVLEQPVVLEEPSNPPPSSSSVTDGQRSPGVPEEEGPDFNHDSPNPRAEQVEAARKVLHIVQRRAGLRAARRLAPLQVTELAGLLAPALAAGWSADDAADALDGELDTADNLFGVLRRRVRDLTRKPVPDPATARSRAGRPQSVPVVACTTCDPHNPGWLDVDGPARKCPTCVPGKPGRMYATPA